MTGWLISDRPLIKTLYLKRLGRVWTKRVNKLSLTPTPRHQALIWGHKSFKGKRYDNIINIPQSKMSRHTHNVSPTGGIRFLINDVNDAFLLFSTQILDLKVSNTGQEGFREALFKHQMLSLCVGRTARQWNRRTWNKSSRKRTNKIQGY